MSRVHLRLLFVMSLVTLAGAGCREEGDIRITGLEFNGVEQIDEGALAGVLQTKKGSWIPWGRQRYFDRRAFEADLKRIEAYYRDRGYPDARVTSFDVDLNDTQDEVDITINIAEGQPITVAGIELTGFDVLPPERRASLQETLPLQEGRPLDRQLEVASRERAVNALRDEGYPYATVELTERESGPRQRTVVLTATPGTLAHFGPVEIVGHASVGEHVLRRQLTFEPGDVFTRQAMRETQRKLYGLELFEFANVESVEDRELQPAEVPVRITVAEGKHRKVNLGVGYGSEERARARLRWDHVNFFGEARHAGFEGKWSSLSRGVRADFREPYFFHPDFSLNFDGQVWQAAEPVYDLDQVGGRATLRHQIDQQNTWSISLLNEFQRSSIANEALLDFTVRDELIALGLDPRDGESRGTLSSIAFDLSRNTTNNLLDARRGYVVNAHVEQAGKWLWGTFNFWSATVEGRHYFSIGDRAVVANRLRVGGIEPFGGGATEANVPFYRRFFLGGASSIRGWGRYEVSPLSGFGFPIGGHAMLEGSSEVRLAVWGNVGAVAFVDYGNVWAGPWDIDFGDLRYAAGPGLRYLTPIGPARVDLGYQLNPVDNLLVNGEPQQRRWRIHFSIGQAF
jgi:outer membrane protein insertion porin family/translocation and assembly module TamA